MFLYTFKNDRTGAYREVRAAAFHEALRRAPSDKGWRFLLSEPVATAKGALGILARD